MQNFSQQQHLTTIRDERAIYSATGEGRIPFIDAEDIAAVAAAALTQSHTPNGDAILLLRTWMLGRPKVQKRAQGKPFLHRICLISCTRYTRACRHSSYSDRSE